jgi:hypothetical protein
VESHPCHDDDPQTQTWPLARTQRTAHPGVRRSAVRRCRCPWTSTPEGWNRPLRLEHHKSRGIFNLSNNQNAFSYAIEKFGDATFSLATGLEPLAKRIIAAGNNSLKYVNSSDLDNYDLRRRIEGVQNQWKAAESLDDTAAISLAKEIVEIAFAMRNH